MMSFFEGVNEGWVSVAFPDEEAKGLLLLLARA